jgi:hypothetical protein
VDHRGVGRLILAGMDWNIRTRPTGLTKADTEAGKNTVGM